DVDLLRIGLEQLYHRQSLRRKSLVELDEIDVFQLQSGSLKRLMRRRYGANSHHRRIDACNGHGAYTHLGLESQLLRSFFGHHEDGGGTDVERARVAGCD